MIEDNETIQRLNYLLTQYNKTQLAEALNISPATIYRWLDGRSTPTGRTVNSINALYEGRTVSHHDTITDQLKQYDPTAAGIISAQRLTTAELAILAEAAYKIAMLRNTQRAGGDNFQPGKS